jgi:hypothetical protein
MFKEIKTKGICEIKYWEVEGNTNLYQIEVRFLSGRQITYYIDIDWEKTISGIETYQFLKKRIESRIQEEELAPLLLSITQQLKSL